MTDGLSEDLFEGLVEDVAEDSTHDSVEDFFFSLVDQKYRKEPYVCS